MLIHENGANNIYILNDRLIIRDLGYHQTQVIKIYCAIYLSMGFHGVTCLRGNMLHGQGIDIRGCSRGGGWETNTPEREHSP